MFNYLWSVSLTYLVPQNLHLRVTLKNLNVENANIKVKYLHGLSLKQCKNIVDLIQNTEIIDQYAQLLPNSLLPVFSSKFHRNPKNKNNAGELRGSDGADQAKGS